jgi:hypothetical protein
VSLWWALTTGCKCPTVASAVPPLNQTHHAAALLVPPIAKRMAVARGGGTCKKAGLQLLNPAKLILSD